MPDPLWIFVFASSLAGVVIAQRRQERVTRAGRAALGATALVLLMVIIETVVELPIDPVLIIGVYMACLIVVVVGSLYDFVVVSGEQAS